MTEKEWTPFIDLCEPAVFQAGVCEANDGEFYLSIIPRSAQELLISERELKDALQKMMQLRGDA